MKKFFSFSKKQKKYHSSFITPVCFSDIKSLAYLHKECFALSWSEEDFENFIQNEHFFGFVARKVGSYKRILGFVLVRFLLDEAEIITLAVDKNYRNRSIGFELLSYVMRFLEKNKAKKLFLEVDEHNIAAQMLYKKLNFLRIGTREGYYQTAKEKTQKNDAFIFCYSFSALKNTSGCKIL